MTKPCTVPEPPFRLDGQGLVLREWTDEDLPAMPALFDDPDVARWTPLASPFDAEAARLYLERAREAREAGRRLQLVVTADGGAPLGEVMLMLKDVDGEVEIGYAIGAAHRGRGLAAAGVRLLTELAHDRLGADRVILRIDPDNAPSAAVARAAGFRLADEPPVVIQDPDGGEIVLRIWERLNPTGSGSH
ncbi:GNAT family N-acetyltransferase [Streptacidiphilus cavernicola]|uniref:GNAT family N-acetyltransferase n=1 Tax=Streptacidiphilus cavernicola TaxID=3342716 RepID=A0ABV6W2L3_9ACTN